MKVFLAGASGAIGRQLIPQLLDAGHEVVGMTRTPAKVAVIEELGARAVVADALDAEQVATRRGRRRAARRSSTSSPRSARWTCATSTATSPSPTGCGPRAPTTCSRPAARSARSASWPRATRAGPTPAPDHASRTRTIRSTRRPRARCGRRWRPSATSSAPSPKPTWTEGIVLRYGALYGPGTSMAPGGEQLEMIRKGKFPVIGDGGGVWSFVHVADAATATVAALERGRRGIYNVVDDEPAPVADWLPAVAARAARAQALARAPVRRAPGRRRGGRGDDDRDPRGVQRQGQARARLGAARRRAGARRSGRA